MKIVHFSADFSGRICTLALAAIAAVSLFWLSTKDTKKITKRGKTG